jgi:hypothetical protein
MRSRSVLRAGGIAIVAAGMAAGVPFSAAAATRGVAFGGLTRQGWPIAFELNKKGTKVRWAAAGLRLDCTSGQFTNQRDGYVGSHVSRKGRFGDSFGPSTTRQDDGSSVVVSSSYHGVFNKRRTAAHGTWRAKLVFRDATGATTDTCDSGSVAWVAKQ